MINKILIVAAGVMLGVAALLIGASLVLKAPSLFKFIGAFSCLCGCAIIWNTIKSQFFNNSNI